ncbi:MAG: hypothetical protein V4580_11330 [Bacteroidota bacterium]
MVHNENFFDFFGIIEDEIRTLYSNSGKFATLTDLYVPAPKMQIPADGIQAIGTKVIMAEKGNDKIVNIFFYISLIILAITIIWLIWEFTKPEPIIQKPVAEDHEDETTDA